MFIKNVFVQAILRNILCIMVQKRQYGELWIGRPAGTVIEMV